jgi:hypothetical protein
MIIIAPVFFIRAVMIHRPDRLDRAILSSARLGLFGTVSQKNAGGTNFVAFVNGQRVVFMIG